jgi:hypothetical protein
VIEYERIQLIRKKAKTEFSHCESCGAQSDFVPLDAAAELFETHTDDLLAFIRGNNCHHTASATTMLCINSLLATMKSRSLDHQFKLEGEPAESSKKIECRE